MDANGCESWRREGRRRPRGGALQVAVCLLGIMVVGATTRADDAEDRRSTSTQYQGGRDESSRTAVTEDRFKPLVTNGSRSSPGLRQGSAKTGSSSLRSLDHEFWFFLADVALFGDDDHDGHFYGIDLLLDADTIFQEADVYAVLYLSLEGGPWNEYHVTDTFRIFGATSEDEYVVVTELETGYPRGSYDLLIELYDTFDGSFVASLGPVDTSELSFLPLEDFRRDDPHFDPPAHGHKHGGGAFDLLFAGILGLFAAGSILRRHAQLRLARTVADQWVARGSGSCTAGSGAGTPPAVRITLLPQADRLSK